MVRWGGRGAEEERAETSEGERREVSEEGRTLNPESKLVYLACQFDLGVIYCLLPPPAPFIDLHIYVSCIHLVYPFINLYIYDLYIYLVGLKPSTSSSSTA